MRSRLEDPRCPASKLTARSVWVSIGSQKVVRGHETRGEPEDDGQPLASQHERLNSGDTEWNLWFPHSASEFRSTSRRREAALRLQSKLTSIARSGKRSPSNCSRIPFVFTFEGTIEVSLRQRNGRCPKGKRGSAPQPALGRVDRGAEGEAFPHSRRRTADRTRHNSRAGKGGCRRGRVRSPLWIALRVVE
jgi:hypothetical protein